MKAILFVIITVSLFSSCKEDKKEISTKEKSTGETDTLQSELSITDENLMNNPFQLGEVNLDKLKREFTNVKIQARPIKNSYIKNQTDSIFVVKINHSEFVIYKLPKAQYLESALIKDRSILLNRNIYVGMSENEFKQRFDALRDRKYIPLKIIVERKESREYLIFTFENNALKEVEFAGYVD
jgi:hypothetical protein